MRGILRDDLGKPMPNATLELSDRMPATPCESSGTAPTGARGLSTEVHGRFCFRIPTRAPIEDLRIRYPGDDYHTPTEAHFSLDLERHPLALAFDAPRLRATLGDPTLEVWVSAESEGAPVGEPASVELFLREAGESERILSTKDATIGGRTRFEVSTHDLGGPGPAHLVARHAGSATFAPSEATAELMRTARVDLELAGKLLPARPESGIVLPIAVRTMLGAVPGGWVEARHGGRPVGMARVRSGAARLVATFEAPRASTDTLSIHYVASDPAWTPGVPLTVDVPLAAPSPWTTLPWIVVAGAVGLWVLRAWRRPPRAALPSKPAEPLPAGRAQIEIVASAPPGAGWTGRVVDAHDGSAVQARIDVLVPTFEGEGVVKTVRASADGAFELPPISEAAAEGARLRVTAPTHSRLERRMPPPGFARVSVVSRRRALLERLIQWAHRAGRPWTALREPTPGEITRLAERRSARDVAAWARAVEDAAFGPALPDERREDALRQAEPPVGHDEH